MGSEHGYKRDLSHTSWAHIWERQAQRGALGEAYWRLGGAKEGARVLEVGCGPGYFALEYARRVGPAGRVVALDVSPDALTFLRAKRGAVSNLDPVLVTDETDTWPAGPFDVAFVTDVLHHADDPKAILLGLQSRAPTLVVSEFSPDGDLSHGPPRNERLAKSQVAEWFEQTGWRAVAEQDLAWDHYALRADARA